jgi:16S rRNA processing protein RimM
MSTGFIQIGVVRRAHGIRGQVRVELYDPRSTAFSTLEQVLLGPGPGPEAEVDPRALRPFRLRGVHELGGGAYLLSLDGIEDRDSAEALRALSIYADRATLPPLQEDEFYLADLAGCQAILPDGTVAGTVREVMALAGQDMLVLSRPGREDALLPIAALDLSYDEAAHTVSIDPPEGLLDLDLPGPRPAARSEGDAPLR